MPTLWEGGSGQGCSWRGLCSLYSPCPGSRAATAIAAPPRRSGARRPTGRPSAAPPTASRTSRQDLRRRRLRLRLRVRAGQHLHDGRPLRHGRARSARSTSAPTAPTIQRGNGVDRQQPRLGLLLAADHRRPRRSSSCWRASRRSARRPRCATGVRGYVAGYNRYLHDVGGPNGVSDPTCKGKPWVTPITELDAYRRFYQLILLASQGVAIDGIAKRRRRHRRLPPPAADASTRQRPRRARARSSAEGRHRLATRSPSARDGTRDHKHGLAARQPALPVARHRALLPGAADHPGQGRTCPGRRCSACRWC